MQPTEQEGVRAGILYTRSKNVIKAAQGPPQIRQFGGGSVIKFLDKDPGLVVCRIPAPYGTFHFLFCMYLYLFVLHGINVEPKFVCPVSFKTMLLKLDFQVQLQSEMQSHCHFLINPFFCICISVLSIFLTF